LLDGPGDLDATTTQRQRDFIDAPVFFSECGGVGTKIERLLTLIEAALPLEARL
jgi:hypothetical protein